ncbi:MAG: M42 family metallopeptidase [Bacteroidetes bacterium]|nr:M42 family metallopeptidase [Bacteroidota bacterium]
MSNERQDEKQKGREIITESGEKFLKSYLNNYSPTGYEVEGQKKWLEYVKPYIDDYLVDAYGTVAAVVNPNEDFKVVIEAHADEISWFVSYISKDGYIYVVRNGGSDHMIAPSKRVVIHGRNGQVEGIFGWPAIHLRKAKSEDTPKITNINIDVGCSSKEEVLELGIHVGCVVTFKDKFAILNNKYYIGRALDNRIGGFVIAEAIRLLKENNVTLPFSLYVVNSVQEEVGLRGAQMIASTIKPDLAIVTDVCHDTNTPGINPKEQGDFKCGDGPVITFAPAIHHILRDLIIQVAEVEGIPYQLDAASRVTGTDAEAFAFSEGGVPTALVSLPLRYMHTTVEMVSIKDVEELIKLMYETIRTIDPNKSFKYFS